jgi:hypothetical protein
LVKNNRASAYIILYILFTIQVVNAFFHIFFSLYYSDFSPGTITAIVLYLPLNFFIVRTAFKEGWLKSYSEYAVIAFLGTITFALFEIYGPVVIALSMAASFIYFIWANNKFTSI